ncbi:LuxR C-terminal-related transcriptional regulator [Streptomyces vietnamensis]|uniref:LuxR C-terminal-related transcriptional regulator n=1 Tax=Streptomyces vietnamensis TaxID=362257 RepID=UPI0037A99765
MPSSRHTVSDVNEGRVIGVASEADLLPKEGVRGVEPRPEEFPEAAEAGAARAVELMSSPAVTVHPDASLAEAARIMARRKVKRLPVVNGIGMLEGVVSRSDLLKVFLREDEEIGAEIRRTVLGGSTALAELDVAVAEGVATLRGALPDRALVPLLARAVLKQIKGSGPVSAVRTVATGQSMLDPATTARLMRSLRDPEAAGPPEDERLAVLSERERPVLDLIGEGLTNRQIAKRLYLSEKTVKNHISRLLGKLGVERRVQAAVIAAQAHEHDAGEK